MHAGKWSKRRLVSLTAEPHPTARDSTAWQDAEAAEWQAIRQSFALQSAHSHVHAGEQPEPDGMPLTAELRAAARDSSAWQDAEAAEWQARQVQIAQQAEQAQRAKRQARADAEEQERLRVRIGCCVRC